MIEIYEDMKDADVIVFVYEISLLKQYAVSYTHLDAADD